MEIPHRAVLGDPTGPACCDTVVEASCRELIFEESPLSGELVRGVFSALGLEESPGQQTSPESLRPQPERVECSKAGVLLKASPVIRGATGDYLLPNPTYESSVLFGKLDIDTSINGIEVRCDGFDHLHDAIADQLQDERSYPQS